MEEGAAHSFKVPPHAIEFTLPSPRIGVESLPVVDPPWMPHVRTRVQEVTLNQDTHVRWLKIDYIIEVSIHKKTIHFFLK